MYNLNVNVATSASSLGVETSCTTPKTPEVLNSVIAMSSSPFTYPGGGMLGPHLPHLSHNNNNNNHHHHAHAPGGGGMHCGGGPLLANSPPSDVFLHPATQMPPPSVQSTCSQLIKEGLKLTIQSKRKHSGSESNLMQLDESYCKMPKMQQQQQQQQYNLHSPLGTSIGSSGDDEVCLTAEDAERRRRRRERNKIAATKCRLKKREKTVNLVQESEVLDTQNADLKSQIKQLEGEQRRLMDMLTQHNQTCPKNIGGANQMGYQQMGGGDPNMGAHMNPQQQQQQHPHQYPNYYAATPGPCSPPQESPPNPYPHHHVELGGYPHHQGMDSGCLA